MAEITKQDLSEALKSVATKNDIEGIETNIQGLETNIHGLETNIQGLGKDIQGLGKKIDKVQKDISSIHSDLIEHDKRNEKMLEHLVENQRIYDKLSR